MSRRVALIGGHGGLSAAYRKVASDLGWSLTHHERRLPHDLGDALVLVAVSTCGHQLAAAARTHGGGMKIIRSIACKVCGKRGRKHYCRRCRDAAAEVAARLLRELGVA